MVTIIGYALRESKEGKKFVSLQLQGGLEMVQSLKTGRFYATCRRCFISSTFDDETAKGLVGTKYPGSIKRVLCDTYDFTVPETGEIISLAHTYQYVPEENASTEVLQPERSKIAVPA